MASFQLLVLVRLCFQHAYLPQTIDCERAGMGSPVGQKGA